MRFKMHDINKEKEQIAELTLSAQFVIALSRILPT